ncbi:MAG TPA: family 43 glycosylhydrolase [Paludibacter sp.]|nr:family 43 glycosylhydrolase [Paludibacter sp.]
MKFKALFLLLLGLVVGSCLLGQQTAKWGDQGDGTYRNPVIPADYSDIDAIRVGNDYYAISSTFQYSPGVVIIHSKDLVNWEILSHVVDDVTVMGPDYNYDKMNRYGRGVWAGSLRYYKGKFWIYYGTPDDGFFMSSATDPAGPWEPLTSLWKTTGWDDCCSFCDDDGQLYFVATNYSDSYKTYLFRLSADGKTVDQASKTFIHQSSGSEANKLLKINGVYYHFFSEVKSEGRVTMMERSSNIWGPYSEIKQLNHVNVSGLGDREPNQGGIIQLPDGTWQFFTHHGSGQWDGRIASLLPVTWVDGWPIIGSVGTDGIGRMVWSEKMPLPSDKSCVMQANDEFSNPKPAVQWEWNYQPRADKWSMSERPGFLRLKAFVPISSSKGILFRVGNTITQRSMRTERCVAVAKLHISKMADGQVTGICHYANTFSTFGIKQVSGVRYIAYNNNGSETLGKAITDSVVYVRSVWGFSGQSQYAYSTDSINFIPVGSPYPMTWGYYRGDRVALFTYNETSENGLVDVDWFHYDYNAQYTIPVAINPGNADRTHMWTFDDGTAKDVVGSADGTLRGGATIENGALKTDANGQYLELPATQLGLTSYPALTMEAWFQSKANNANTGYTMLSYFGNVVNNMGSNGCFLSVARGDNISRAGISCGNTTSPSSNESYANALELDDGAMHQVAGVFNNDVVSIYVDGVNISTGAVKTGNVVSNILLNYAYLAKSGYSGDPTWLGKIDKFTIYKKALSDGEVQYLYQHPTDFPSAVSQTKLSNISIYPNPATDFIYCQSDENIGNARFDLTNLAGQVVLSQKMSNSTKGKFDISSFPSGIYVAKVSISESNTTALIVKN